jgi:hypothetical protein
MATAKTGGQAQTPYVYDAADYLNRHLTITINFDNATRALTSGVVHRDPDCMYTKILIGIGADGRPDSSTHKFDVGKLEGDRTFTGNQMSVVGLNTIEDVFALGQIAAAP